MPFVCRPPSKVVYQTPRSEDKPTERLPTVGLSLGHGGPLTGLSSMTGTAADSRADHVGRPFTSPAKYCVPVPAANDVAGVRAR